MTFTVRIEQEAHDNIQGNALWWTENHSPDQAIKWERAVYDQLRELATMPERHGLAFESNEFPFDLHQQLLGIGKTRTYRALFRIEESTVVVLTFLAAEQDDWQGDAS
jgi:plasmid stabilization system protein ParE